MVEVGTPISCTFEITHKSAPVANEAHLVHREPPNLDSALIKRLLGKTGTSLVVKPLPTTTLVCDTTYLLTTQLVRGPTPTSDPHPPSLSIEDEEHTGASLPTSSLSLAKEPTLEELAMFSETSLRGKRAVLHAQESSTFARHLTSYLTSWGLDVGHMPINGPAGDVPGGFSDQFPRSALNGAPTGPFESATVLPVDPAIGLLSPQSTDTPLMDPSGVVATPPESVAPATPAEPLFVIVDDDVDVLRRILNRYRPEVSPLKRPSLALNHRPRSSPQIRNVLGIGPNDKRSSNLRPSAEPSNNFIIVHITSLANFKLVKDTVQSALFLVPPSRMPDIMVLPKPAGPRRFLTALYTAVRKPMVDPYFFPIATSPQSPGGVSPTLSHLSMHSSSRKLSSGQRSGGATSPTTTRSSQQGVSGSPTDWASISNNSPRDRGPPSTVSSSDHGGTPQASPMSAADSLGYFTPSAVKMGTTASSGVVLQSPDGRPTGIYFQPHRGSTMRQTDSGSGTPTSRSSRSSTFDTRSSRSGTPRYDESRGVPLQRERRPPAEPSAPGIPFARSRRHVPFEDDNSPTPTLASFSRPSRSRPGSSRSRPNSAGGSRDPSSPSTSGPQDISSGGRAVGPSRRLSGGSRLHSDDTASSPPINNSPAASTPPVAPPLGASLSSIDAVVSAATFARVSSPPRLPPSIVTGPPPLIQAGSSTSVATTSEPSIKTLPKTKKPATTTMGKNAKPSNGITPPISVLIAEGG